MVEKGRIAGARKNIDKYKIVATIALGTKKTYDFINDNPMCFFKPVNYTNDPCVIGQLDKFVSINSCIDVDLYGQINRAEALIAIAHPDYREELIKSAQKPGNSALLRLSIKPAQLI